MRSKPVSALLVDLDVIKTHSRGIGYMTPHAVHHGEAVALNLQRAETLNAAFSAHPARFKGIVPKPPSLPTAAWINPPKKGNAESPHQSPGLLTKLMNPGVSILLTRSGARRPITSLAASWSCCSKS